MTGIDIFIEVTAPDGNVYKGGGHLGNTPLAIHAYLAKFERALSLPKQLPLIEV